MTDDKTKSDVSTTRAAEMLGVSLPTVREWIREGVLEGFQLNPGSPGSPYRVVCISVEALIEERKRQHKD